MKVRDEKYWPEKFEIDIARWTGFWSTNVCGNCGYQLNGATFLPDLLTKPNDCRCGKCGDQWSTAISDGERKRITHMLEEAIRHSVISADKAYIEDLLHGRIDVDGTPR